jgi:hypothetical protein
MDDGKLANSALFSRIDMPQEQIPSVSEIKGLLVTT